MTGRAWLAVVWTVFMAWVLGWDMARDDVRGSVSVAAVWAILLAVGVFTNPQKPSERLHGYNVVTTRAWDDKLAAARRAIEAQQTRAEPPFDWDDPRKPW